MAPSDGGMEASRRMHEYLLSKQRKQEEFWLRKYGKVLQAPPPSVGKQGHNNPRLPPIAGSSSGVGSERSSGLGEPSGSGAGPMLPLQNSQAQLPGMLPHHHRQPKGQAPIFHAKEPVKDFFTRNARQPPAGQGGGAGGEEYGNAQLANHRPPEPYRKGRPAQLPPLAPTQQPLPQGMEPLSDDPSDASSSQAPSHQPSQQARSYEQYSQYEQYQQEQLVHNHGSEAALFQQHQAQLHGRQMQQQVGAKSGNHIRAPPYVAGVSEGGAARTGAFPGRLPPLQHEHSASSKGFSQNGVGSQANVAPSPHANNNKPLRNLELELTVIKAIKAREDVLERLRIAGGKLDAGFGGVAPVVLSPVDPLVRLFYRLVATLRQRTLDAVEAIAAWRRKVSPSDPFIYFGVDYLAAIGPDAAFLDELPFLRSRLTFGKAADDPFLAEVTPDGIPIEEATTCDLRRGGQRFSSDALRIRMARKVLAHYCGRPLPYDVSASSLMLDGGVSGGGAAGDGLYGELSQPRLAQGQQQQQPMVQVQPIQLGIISPEVRKQQQKQREEERERERLQQQQEQQMEVAGDLLGERAARSASPQSSGGPSSKAGVVLPPAVRAITPPAVSAVTFSATAAVKPAAVASQEREDTFRVGEEEDEEEGADVAVGAGEEEEEEEQEDSVGKEERQPQQEQEQELEELPQPEELAPQAQQTEELPPLLQPLQPTPEQQEQPQTPPQQQPEEEVLVFEEDGDYIDFALAAIINSLEPQYADAVQPGSFTVAGWEIDQQLEEMVRGIASPEKASRGGARGGGGSRGGWAPSVIRLPSPAVRASATPTPPPAAGDQQKSQPGLSEVRRSQIPQPSSSLSPLGRGSSSSAEASKPSSARGGVGSIPRPPPPPALQSPQADKPSSRGPIAAAQASSSSPAKPPFRGSSRIPVPPSASSLTRVAEEVPAPLQEDAPNAGGMERQEDLTSAAAAGASGGYGGGDGAGEFIPASSSLYTGGTSAEAGESRGATYAARSPEPGNINVDTPSRPIVEETMQPRLPEAAPGAAEEAGTGWANFLVPPDSPLPPPPPPIPDDDNDDTALRASVVSTADPWVAQSAEEQPDAVAGAAVPTLEGMPLPLQGPLSSRGNRASLRSGRQSGSRPGSAAGVLG